MLKMIAPIEIIFTKGPGLLFSFLGAPPKNPADIKSGEMNNPMRISQTAQS